MARKLNISLSRAQLTSLSVIQLVQNDPLSPLKYYIERRKSSRAKVLEAAALLLLHPNLHGTHLKGPRLKQNTCLYWNQ